MDRTAAATISSSIHLARGRSVAEYRRRRPALVARREEDLALIRRHLGRLPVSEVLANTDRDAAEYRDGLVSSMRELDEHTFFSLREVVTHHRDPLNPFSLNDFDFVHMPGGHAPMVDFVDSPWLGEFLHTVNESGVLISLICHAPVAMVSAQYRVDPMGEVRIDAQHRFVGAHITTVPRHGEQLALVAAYPRIPKNKTRLEYFVDDRLKEAGYRVDTSLDPTGVKVVWDESVRLLTGNGPQSIDAQTRRLRVLLTRPAEHAPM
jgi:putative intracellular protease/amidase